LGIQYLPAHLAAFCLAAICNFPAWAKKGEPDENTVVYDENFFSRYSVNNAEDMLRLVPGVQAILDTRAAQQERGFGTAGARVLINGRRFPGNANEINTNLRRILYVTKVMDGTIRRTEQWDETRDLRIALRLRGLF
jgi:hypothetical protein